MKLDKFLKILISLVLILFIAFLLKSLIIVPKDLYAKANVEYTLAEFGAKDKNVDYELNKYAKEGWRLHTILLTTYEGKSWFMFIYEK